MFDDRFVPRSADVFDPVVFKPIEIILDEPSTPGTVIAESP